MYLALAFPRKRKETEPVACGRLVGIERRDTEREFLSPLKNAFLWEFLT